jgi:hypothetical protein
MRLYTHTLSPRYSSPRNVFAEVITVAAKRRKPIRIKPSNKGKLRKSTGTKKGQKIPVSTLRKKAKSSNSTTRKRAQFALNARKWSKGKKKR